MAYNASIPQPTDQLSQSQSDILGNFQALANVVGANSGSVTFPNQVVAPTFPANQDGLYSLTPAISPFPELYVNKNNQNGTTSQIPFTASTLSTTSAAPAQFSNGWSYLPSGIIIKWGSVAYVAGTVTFDTTVAFSQVLTIQTTILSASGAIGAATVKTVSNTQFTYSANSGGDRVLYFAIGY